MIDDELFGDECGQEYRLNDDEKTQHLDADGDVDYDADADHVPFSREDTGYQLRASFDAEAWLNDCATSVDPQGDTDWDCTAFVDSQGLRPKVEKAIAEQDEWLDRDDVLVDDPAAPAWIREWAWHGPFTITVRRAEEGDNEQP
jgi:hypothetical protein